ncbi:GM18487 [Drosophila sechellia]|uniref:GM18487 n=1 Tax=Drosophila sechellia TaxID=7238 RepID=B4I3B9_DROSE|nr:GM18487 [Drosophila sechellia]
MSLIPPLAKVDGVGQGIRSRLLDSTHLPPPFRQWAVKRQQQPPLYLAKNFPEILMGQQPGWANKNTYILSP